MLQLARTSTAAHSRTDSRQRKMVSGQWLVGTVKDRGPHADDAKLDRLA
jgi:hypothetical protein